MVKKFTEWKPWALVAPKQYVCACVAKKARTLQEMVRGHASAFGRNKMSSNHFCPWKKLTFPPRSRRNDYDKKKREKKRQIFLNCPVLQNSPQRATSLVFVMRNEALESDSCGQLSNQCSLLFLYSVLCFFLTPTAISAMSKNLVS